MREDSIHLVCEAQTLQQNKLEKFNLHPNSDVTNIKIKMQRALYEQPRSKPRQGRPVHKPPTARGLTREGRRIEENQ